MDDRELAMIIRDALATGKTTTIPGKTISAEMNKKEIKIPKTPKTDMMRDLLNEIDLYLPKKMATNPPAANSHALVAGL